MGICRFRRPHDHGGPDPEATAIRWAWCGRCCSGRRSWIHRRRLRRARRRDSSPGSRALYSRPAAACCAWRSPPLLRLGGFWILGQYASVSRRRRENARSGVPVGRTDIYGPRVTDPAASLHLAELETSHEERSMMPRKPMPWLSIAAVPNSDYSGRCRGHDHQHRRRPDRRLRRQGTEIDLATAAGRTPLCRWSKRLPDGLPDRLATWPAHYRMELRIVRLCGPASEDPAALRGGHDQEFVGYLAMKLAERRAAPTDDMISDIATLRIDGEPLSDADADPRWPFRPCCSARATEGRMVEGDRRVAGTTLARELANFAAEADRRPGRCGPRRRRGSRSPCRRPPLCAVRMGRTVRAGRRRRQHYTLPAAAA